jgi:hypothetical protein
MFRSTALGLLLVGLVGCGGSIKVAPVSGTITLNGKPLANATVTFQPIGSKENPNPGRGSFGVTDANGKYTLKYDDGRSGAVVGKHRVAVVTNPPNAPSSFNNETGSTDGEIPEKFREIIPSKYNDQTELTCDVPAGGKDNADYQLVVPGLKR